MHKQLIQLEDPLGVLESVFAQMPIGFTVFSDDGFCQFVNKAAVDLFGVRPPSEYSLFKDEILIREGLHDLIKRGFQGEIINFPRFWYDPNELKHVKIENGRRVAIEASLFPIRNRQKDVKFITLIFKDVTNEALYFERVKEMEIFLAQSYAAGRIGTWTFDLVEEKLFWSPEIFKIFGVDPNGFKNSPEDYWKHIFSEDVEMIRAAVHKSFNDNSPYTCEHRFKHVDGSIGWVIENAKIVRDNQGKPLRLVGVIQDITEKKLVEKSAQQSETRFRTLFDSELIGVYIVRKDGPVIDSNNYFLKMIGYTREDLLNGRISWQKLTPPEFLHLDMQGLKEIEQSGECKPFRKEYIRKDGTRVPILIGASLPDKTSTKEIVCFALDMTQIKDLERQLLQSQKMESVGRLAGGVAHDFNNIIAVILLQVEKLLLSLKDSNHVPDLRAIQVASQKAAKLTQQLLSFSSQKVFEHVEVDVAKVLKENEKLLVPLVGQASKLIFSIPDDLPKVTLGEGFLDQILMNLVVNAKDAIQEGGEIKVKAHRRDLNESQIDALKLTDLTSGLYVEICVTDNGTGIPPEILNHIFDPFFTTKELGKGTGLGLSTVYGMVKEARGTITVQSKEGVGTQFCIYLPGNTKKSFKLEERHSSKNIKAGKKQNERILLVDDELELRRVTAEILEMHGYEVITAANGREAIEKVKASPNPISLIITDVMMPEMTGPAFVKEVTHLLSQNSTKVLYLSGYSSDELSKQYLLDNSVKIMQKPFSYESLIKKVQECLPKPQ